MSASHWARPWLIRGSSRTSRELYVGFGLSRGVELAQVSEIDAIAPTSGGR